MTHTTQSMGVDNAPGAVREIPGFAFLRAPAGRSEQAEATAETLEGSLEGAPPPQTVTTHQNLTAPQPGHIAGLLRLWLEALDGRRTVESLRRGPFSPIVLDALATRVRSNASARSSKIMSLHIVPSTPGIVRFCASACIDTRIRAITGVLAVHSVKAPAALHEVRLGRVKRKRYWRLETMSMV